MKADSDASNSDHGFSDCEGSVDDAEIKKIQIAVNKRYNKFHRTTERVPDAGLKQKCEFVSTRVRVKSNFGVGNWFGVTNTKNCVNCAKSVAYSLVTGFLHKVEDNSQGMISDLADDSDISQIQCTGRVSALTSVGTGPVGRVYILSSEARPGYLGQADYQHAVVLVATHATGILVIDGQKASCERATDWSEGLSDEYDNTASLFCMGKVFGVH